MIDDQTAKGYGQAKYESHSRAQRLQLINQVGFSGSLEESKRDVNYRNDPTSEGVSNSESMAVVMLLESI